MKIVYLCEFSAGVDGVWNRVLNIAKHVANKHDVSVFSSNIEKGSEGKAKSFEIIDNVKIYRFPVKFRLGENALFWNYSRKLLEIKPDVVHAHVFRHPHTTTAPKLAMKIGAKCFLTTHGPFVEKSLRSSALNLAVKVYDKLFARKVLNSYDKVVAITKWEIPFLLRLGCRKEKIIHIPNGFPGEILRHRVKLRKSGKKTIVFLGRIAPIKNIELLLRAYKSILDRGYDLHLKLVGQIEKGYEIQLMRSVKSLNLNGRVEFTGPIYDLKKKITMLGKSDIFVLPSKREASPQALAEAMALGMIVVSSSTLGGRELIRNRKNGFIFSNLSELENVLEYLLRNFPKLSKIGITARKSVETLSWEKLAKSEEELYKNF